MVLPKDLKLTKHARQRLEERNKTNNIYDVKNLMRSSVKWYGKDDLIPESALYIHCLYVCRKAKNKMGYMTDGNIEVLYDKNAGVAITIMEVKEKFLPITQYIKPSVLRQVKEKKEIRKMKKFNIGTCPDCGKQDVQITSQGICVQCRTRKTNAKAHNKEYIPYVNLPQKDKEKIDTMQRAQAIKKELAMVKPIEPIAEINAPKQDIQAPTIELPKLDPLSDQNSFVAILKECGCKISDETLKELLNVLIATNKLKDLLLTITANKSQDALLDLEQILNVAERKLQHDWEYNGFRETDDIKFKGFLIWRRMLKSSIYFWKKLYSTNTLIELQRAWAAYTADPTEKQTLSKDRPNSIMKRYQITTETISTIFNSRRAFTRVFYATSEDGAKELLTKWLTDRQLHEDKSKTKIVELSTNEEVK